MFSKILLQLWSPYPFPGENWNPFITAIFMGACVSFVLFNMLGGAVSSLQQLWRVTAYGVVCALTILLNNGLLSITFQHKRRTWTLLHEALWVLYNFVIIALVNLQLTNLIYGQYFSLREYGQFLLITISIGWAPLMVILLYRQNTLLRNHLAAAKDLSSYVSGNQESPNYSSPTAEVATSAKDVASSLLTLKGNNPGVSLSFRPAELLYCEANRNYVKLHFQGNDEPASIRSTLRKVEQQLQGFPDFFRCHRAFIVNLGAIERVSGNSQGLQLSLVSSEEKVPVSRSFIGELRNRITLF